MKIDKRTKVFKALDATGKEMVKILTKNLISDNKDATGALIRSLDYNIVATTNGILIELISEDYLKWVDEGRRPGGKMPPIKALDRWVVARGIAPRDSKGRFQTREQVKWAIAKSIAKNGIEETNVIDRTIDELYSNMSELLKKAAVEDIEDMVEKMLNIKYI